VTDVMLPRIFQALDIALVERRPDGAFELLTPSPDWLQRTFDRTPTGARPTTETALPFLNDVVAQAVDVWRHEPDAAVPYGPFGVKAGRLPDDEVLLRATAIMMDRRILLVLEHLTGVADARPMIQKARERMLESESLARQASAVHAPTQAVEAGISALQAAPLTPDVKPLVDGLAAAFAKLRETVSALPPPPTRQRR
jgi:hypothetical protein